MNAQFASNQHLTLSRDDFATFVAIIASGSPLGPKEWASDWVHTKSAWPNGLGHADELNSGQLRTAPNFHIKGILRLPWLGI
jgi:hypothetical protein